MGTDACFTLKDAVDAGYAVELDEHGHEYFAVANWHCFVIGETCMVRAKPPVLLELDSKNILYKLDY
jgi:hypothetical protein